MFLHERNGEYSPLIQNPTEVGSVRFGFVGIHTPCSMSLGIMYSSIRSPVSGISYQTSLTSCPSALQ